MLLLSLHCHVAEREINNRMQSEGPRNIAQGGVSGLDFETKTLLWRELTKLVK